MKKILWDSMLTADLNVRYWLHLSRWYNDKNIVIKVLLVFAAVGTVLSWFFISGAQLLWKVLSTISAFIAIVFLFVDWGRWIEKMYLLRKEWMQVRDEYEMLWATFRNKDKNSDELYKEYKKIKDKEAYLAYIGSGLPYKEKLKYKCQEEVLRFRGLKK